MSAIFAEYLQCKRPTKVIIRGKSFTLYQQKIMKRKISLMDFDFHFAGYGHYRVTYISPVTGKQWTRTTDNMPLIDATKNEDEPKRKDLETLKRFCKGQF